jgi:SAM-dependent methyltransferase
VSDASYGIGLSNVWSDAQRRLAAAEELLDPGTIRHLDTIGIAAGMRCLELGAGGGSIARFMAERVGPAGWVLVTDIDVGKLAECNQPNVEVRVHDICTDPLEDASFDIIHARLLLEHLPPRLAVLDKLVAALRPGGWLLVEDVDLTEWQYLPEERLFLEPRHLRAAYKATVVGSASIGSTAGWDGEFARDLPLHLVNAGLDCVDGEVCSPLVVGGLSKADFATLSWREIGPALIDAGHISEHDLDSLIAAFENPGAMAPLLKMVSAWGRRTP